MMFEVDCERLSEKGLYRGVSAASTSVVWERTVLGHARWAFRCCTNFEEVMLCFVYEVQMYLVIIHGLKRWRNTL